MAPKWKPMPESIRAALVERVTKKYGELIARLPNIGVPNPDIQHDVTTDGFKADVRFYNDKGGYSSSLWEYTFRDRSWRMYHDWQD